MDPFAEQNRKLGQERAAKDAAGYGASAVPPSPEYQQALRHQTNQQRFNLLTEAYKLRNDVSAMADLRAWIKEEKAKLEATVDWIGG